MRRIAAVLLIASFLVACQDSEPTRPSEPGPVSLGISDGGQDDGNPEFFFFPPLVPNPKKDPDFGDNPFNTDLAPVVRICELVVPDPGDPYCVGGPIESLPMALDLDKEQYRVNWSTGGSDLVPNTSYRIEVMLGDQSIGFRDVEAVSRRVRRMSCKNEPFCRFNVGSVIPIKVRIEMFADCHGTRCQWMSFNLQDGASFEVQYEEDRRILLDVPEQGQDQDVTMSFGLCSADDSARVVNLIDLPTFGPCASTEILGDWNGVLDPDATATVSFCDLEDRNFGLELPQQADHLRVHAFHEDGTIESLRERDLCNGGLGSLPTNPFLRFASQVRDRVSSWIGVRPLMASAAAVGPGARGGNSLGTIRTEFIIALGGKIDYVDAGDTTRTGPPGSDLTTRAKVTDLGDNPVAGATVRWKVVEPSEVDPYLVIGDVWSPSCAEVGDELVCETDGDGEVTVTWTLADDPGVNKLIAGGLGIADARNGFNGPRDIDYYPRGPFDPFTPIAWEELEGDGIDDDEDEGADTIVAGTRLLFTAVGAPAGLVSWWPGDGNASDIVGGNDGSLENGTTFATGLVNQAFKFDGADDFVVAPGSGIDDLEELTIETWVKLNSLPSRIERFVTLPVEKAVLRHDGENSPGQLHYYMITSTGQRHIRVNNILQSGCFHHVAGTYDGSMMRVYLDGVEVGNRSFTRTLDAGYGVELSSATETLDGLLDEVKIHDHALDLSEIQAIYSAGGPGKCEPPIGFEEVLYSVSTVGDELSNIYVGAYEATIMPIGPLGPDPEAWIAIAMAVRPSDKEIFVWNNDGGGRLATVDVCSGLATEVDPETGPQGSLSALAFHPTDGDLFGVGWDLFSVDPGTGEKTIIGSLGSGLRVGGADFDQEGVLWGVELPTGEGAPPEERLVTIDTETGTATVVAELSEDIGVIGSIVFHDGRLIGSGGSQPYGEGYRDILFEIDTTDGTVSNIRTILGESPIPFPQGMGFAPMCEGY